MYMCVEGFHRYLAAKDTLKGVAVTIPKKNTKEKRRNE